MSNEAGEPLLTGGRPIVLVTGASGFVGRHVARELERGGWAVRSALRAPSGGENEVLIDSIGPTTDWRAALAGVEAVVHLAARVHRSNEGQEVELYRTINTEGTLHLARCAANAGVRQFVFVSSVLVHGRTNDGRAPFRENDNLTPRGVYGTSKAVAEAGLKELALGDMCVTVVRPPLVYGAGAKGNFELLVKAVKLGIPLPFAAIRNHRAVLSVQNLASFILQRLSRADTRFDVFLLADAEQVSTPEFISRLAKAAGARSRLFPVPTAILNAVFRTGGLQDTRDSLLGSLELDVSKAVSTGWRPPLTLDEGLRLATTASESDD
jgi:UDP-glucose 4-epimerase